MNLFGKRRFRAIVVKRKGHGHNITTARSVIDFTDLFLSRLYTVRSLGHNVLRSLSLLLAGFAYTDVRCYICSIRYLDSLRMLDVLPLL